MSPSSALTIPAPVRLPAGDVMLSGDLGVPAHARGLVTFAHGSGSGRHSTRNRTVAEALQRGGFATLLMDLLTDVEERTDVVTAEFRFDIPLLASRVIAAVDWASEHSALAPLPHGVFGASTGAAAALIGASKRPDAVRAVVSRGGRPDLAGDALERVVAPTRLIVGGCDEVVIDLNERALARMPAITRLDIVPGATHLFEEPGALERVSALALEWFARWLR
jgi:putative phosphoribosyl transferase